MGMAKNKDSIKNITGCIRKVSSLERVFLWKPNDNVFMVARILGDVSEERLRRALDAVRRMHPLVGAKIVFDRDHNGWFSTDGVPEPGFKTVCRVSDTQWFEELQREIRTPFNLETGPMIRFVLLRSEGVSDLMIMCSHCICDGMSLAYLVRDLFTRYTDPGQEVRVLSPPDITDFLPKRGFSRSSVMKQLVVYRINRRWKKSPHYFDHEDYAAIQAAYREKNAFGTVLLELDPRETQALSERCKAHGVTVGSTVTAAFIAAHEAVIGPFAGDHKQVSIPFDLRRHATAPVGDVFCLCVGAPRFPYTYDAEKPFWENASVLHGEIHRRVKRLDYNGTEVSDFDPAFLDAATSFAPLKEVIPEAYTRTENLARFLQDTDNVAFSMAKRIAHRSRPGIIPSNLGRLDIPEAYGDLRIDRMILLPSGGDFIPMVLGGVSIGGRMVFSLNYPEPKSSGGAKTGEMIRIRNKALEYLGFPDKMDGRAMA